MRAVEVGENTGWHLWDGLAPESVGAGVEEIRSGLEAWLGPAEETTPDRVGVGYSWRTGEFLISLYFHSGLPPEGIERPRSSASAQVGVERAVKEE